MLRIVWIYMCNCVVCFDWRDLWVLGGFTFGGRKEVCSCFSSLL